MHSLNPRQFSNRELSWLEFNQRVLDEALDDSVPLLERVKFLCISHSNLDEFFEVRVAGLKQQVESQVTTRSLDGQTPEETYRQVINRVRRMVRQQYLCWQEQLLPALARNGIHFRDPLELNSTDLQWAERYYRAQVRPVLTPISIDPAHPFPLLLNNSLNLMVQLELALSGQPLRHLAVVQVPRVLPRLLRLPRPEPQREYIFLAHLIGYFLADLFPGAVILGYWPFRVTRNSELYIDEEEVANLLHTVENELRNRRKGAAVRLQLQAACPGKIQKALLKTLRLENTDLFPIPGPVNLACLTAICEGDHSPELRDPLFIPRVSPALQNRPDLFSAIRERDILLHHPYDSFETVLEFLEQAARDPDVLAVKITLYRTGGAARLIGALLEAVNSGKQVTVVVELRARFEEANNIQWARQLEEAGVQVVYGLVGYKIHAKVCLVVRRERQKIVRYIHLSTGNYNPSTARLYTDLGLLTCRPDFGEDVTNLFNLLTGICQFQPLRKLLVAPFDLHERILQFIQRETEHARRGLPARIIAKMNSLVDPQIIQALYAASQAGVQIDLIVRGICCLRPGLSGLSENIRVRNIVDRFLEHSRIFYFENACHPQLFLSSADWMPRNFFHRIELAFPVEDGILHDQLSRIMLGTWLADNTKVRFLASDGTYSHAKLKAGEQPRRSQLEFMFPKEEPSFTFTTQRKRNYPKVKLRPRPQRA